MAGELITGDRQIEWRGLLLGAGTPYRWDTLDGWRSLPPQRGGGEPLPSRHGSYPGRQVSGTRTITLEFKLRVPRAEFASAVDDLLRATAPDEDPVEEPLAVRLDGETLMTWARITRRAIPSGRHYALGYTTGALQWQASDPRLYSANEVSATATLAAPAGGGLDFGAGGLDLTSGGLDFGTGVSGGELHATNTGHVPTWPVFEVDGPCQGPSIIYGGRELSFNPDFTVLDGQTLVIDTQPGRRTVTIAGVSMRQHLWTAQWTPFQPGERTRVRFTATQYDAAARLRAFWRHAKH